MRVAFFASEKQREQELAEAFLAGVKKHGDTGIDQIGERNGTDVAVMVGVKSLKLYQECRAQGIHTIMLDKGYQRHKQPGERIWEYWRVAIDAHHPTATLMKVNRPRDRMNDLELTRWRTQTKRGHIVIAGSSAKYHRFYDLPEPTEYATALVARLRQLTKRPIVYRPKPSWHDAIPIHGTKYSPPGEKIGDVLWGAHALVTHGSNACFESVLAGVPCIILGDGVARPISSTDIADIQSPHLASMRERQRWLAALSYCQWTLDEFSSGKAWGIIRPQIGIEKQGQRS